MSTFLNSLQAEILKAKNSFAFWLAWIGTSGIAVAFFLIQAFSPEPSTLSDTDNPWHHFVDAYYAGSNFMLLPLFIIIIASLVTFMEHRAGMWKHLFVLNVPYWHLYASKLIFLVLLFMAAHFYFITLMLLSGAVLGMLQPARGLSDASPDFLQVFTLGIKTVLSILGLLAVQYWISMRFRSFIVPLGVGVISFVIATILVENSTWALYVPHAHPLLYTQGYPESLSVAQMRMVSEVEMVSMLYFMLFGILGYVDTRRLDIR